MMEVNRPRPYLKTRAQRPYANEPAILIIDYYSYFGIYEYVINKLNQWKYGTGGLNVYVFIYVEILFSD